MVLPKRWCQANDHQCPNCHPVHKSQILCCKCERASDSTSETTCEVCNSTALSPNERECLKRGLQWWSCCNTLTTVTMLNSDLQHPPHQPAMRSFVTPITVPSLSTSTCFECRIMIKKSSLIATCITCGQCRHLVCAYLPRCERESIRDGHHEWLCCDTAQSPSTSTMPRPLHNQSNTQEHHVTRASNPPENTRRWGYHPTNRAKSILQSTIRPKRNRPDKSHTTRC